MVNVKELENNKEIYRLIRSIYKFIPYYNKIKGSYLGIMFMLNTMGLRAKIVELWSTRDELKNFAKPNYIREDELNAMRDVWDFIGEGIDENTPESNSYAMVKNYYLTSSFDVDVDTNNLSFKEFNGMARTLIDVINQIRPVTRCLRKLYYVLLVNTNIHFNYLMENTEDNKSPVLTYGSDPVGDSNPMGIDMRIFDYIWYLYPKILKKSEYEEDTGTLHSIYLPYDTLGARCTLNRAGMTRPGNYTVGNSFFNLCQIKEKFKKSNQFVFKFMVYARNKNHLFNWVNTGEIIALIDDDIMLSTDRNGIILKFNTPALYNIIQELISKLDEELGEPSTFEDLNLFVASHVVAVLGTDYMFQKEGWYDWNINYLLGEDYGLIPEETGSPTLPFVAGHNVHLASQHNETLIGEDYDE